MAYTLNDEQTVHGANLSNCGTDAWPPPHPSANKGGSKLCKSQRGKTEKRRNSPSCDPGGFDASLQGKTSDGTHAATGQCSEWCLACSTPLTLHCETPASIASCALQSLHNRSCFVVPWHRNLGGVTSHRHVTPCHAPVTVMSQVHTQSPCLPEGTDTRKGYTNCSVGRAGKGSWRNEERKQIEGGRLAPPWSWSGAGWVGPRGQCSELQSHPACCNAVHQVPNPVCDEAEHNQMTVRRTHPHKHPHTHPHTHQHPCSQHPHPHPDLSRPLTPHLPPHFTHQLLFADYERLVKKEEPPALGWGEGLAMPTLM